LSLDQKGEKDMKNSEWIGLFIFLSIMSSAAIALELVHIKIKSDEQRQIERGKDGQVNRIFKRDGSRDQKTDR